MAWPSLTKKESLIMPANFLFSLSIILISACGISYQFLISRVLIQFSQDEVLNQSVTLGFYLLSMGLGAALADKLFLKDNRLKLYFIEITLACVGILLVPLIYLFHVGINIFFFLANNALFYGNTAVFGLQVFTVLIGFLTGFELPLLMAMAQENKASKFSDSRVLALSYLGALLGSLFSAGLLIPKIDFISSGVLIGLFSLLAATILIVVAIDKIKKMILLFILIPFAMALAIIQWAPKIEQLFLKDYYVNIKVPQTSIQNIETMLKFFSSLESVERYITNYQIIDMTPDQFMDKYDQDTGFVVYLNNQVQFGRKNYEMYHETMVHGSINVAHKIPQNVLILGGGDGLILSELLKLDDVKSITQVELDPQMIELATYHPVLRELNQAAYSKERVHLIYEDGFHYVRTTKDKFDAIFIDFPFPTSYDLSKLYSLEFYRSLRKSMTEKAFFVFDAPVVIQSDLVEALPHPSPQDIILSTLNAAHFNSIYAFGLTESFYVVSATDQPLKIDYETLPKWLKNQTIANLSVLNHALTSAEISKNYVNSIFKPQKFIFK